MNSYYIASTHTKPNGISRLELQHIISPSMDAAIGYRTTQLMVSKDCAEITNIIGLEHKSETRADRLAQHIKERDDFLEEDKLKVPNNEVKK